VDQVSRVVDGHSSVCEYVVREIRDAATPIRTETEEDR